MRYATDEPGDRLSVALDALTAIYHRLSGQTNLLAEPAPQILDALAAGPADAAEIVRRLGEAHDFDTRDAELSVIARLAELEDVGLVWRA